MFVQLKSAGMTCAILLASLGSGPLLSTALAQGQEFEFDEAPGFVQDAIVDYGVGSTEYVTVNLFEGDASGNGHDDALLVFYYFEQNALMVGAYVFEGDAEGLARVGQVEIVGTEPRDFAAEDGAFLLTTTIAQAGDQRCCPTGRRDFRIALPE